MYGVPKYKENFLMKRRKEILGILLIAFILSLGFGNANIFNNKLAKICYIMEYEGQEIGKVLDEEEGRAIYDEAYLALTDDLGYAPELVGKPVYTSIQIKKKDQKKDQVERESLVASLKDSMKTNLKDIREEAYILRIGNKFTVALKDEATAKEVLKLAQSKFLDPDIDIEVNLDGVDYSEMVKKPKVLMLDPEKTKRNLSTSSLESASKTEEVKEAENVDGPKEKVIDVGLASDVLIAKAFVEKGKLVDRDQAVELITKENAEKKKYIVETGDSPSLIASKNGMKLSELYDLNPGLEGSIIHTSDEVVVMVPEPEIKVQVVTEQVYNEPILRKTTKVKDNSLYVGTTEVRDQGADGVRQIRDNVTKINGKEVARQLVESKVLTEPRDKVIVQGSKPLPVHSATGKYVYPVKNFKISSHYGYRRGGFHRGTDFAAPRGTTVVAADGGRVVKVSRLRYSYGNHVIIDHGNGVTTLYAHLNSISVSQGQKVAQGQKIGTVGSTGRSSGSHLHFEIRLKGKNVNPMKYLP